MGLKRKTEKLLAKAGHLCLTCCGGRFKCDTTTHVCSQTTEPLTNPNVYPSLNACMENCGEECLTSGCDFNVQFYYLAEWGGHQCDRAVFNAYVGNRLLGTVNLNNGGDGASRYSDWFQVGVNDFIAASCSYTFSLMCELSSCHQGIAGIKFSSGLELPALLGDVWGVSANDICNPAP